jgi:hypothetical protein
MEEKRELKDIKLTQTKCQNLSISTIDSLNTSTIKIGCVMSTITIECVMKRWIMEV